MELHVNRAVSYRAGAWAVVLQLVGLATMMLAAALWGGMLGSATDYFNAYARSPVRLLVQSNLWSTLFLIVPYWVSCVALYLALRHRSQMLVTYATAACVVAVILAIGSDPTVALVRLATRFAASSDAAERNALLAAAETVIANDGWHGTAGYMTGVLLQGAGVVYGLLMYRSADFARVTAISGVTANGLDLVQHLLHPFLPAVSIAIVPVMGLGYLVWFPALARDLFALGRHSETSRSSS